MKKLTLTIIATAVLFFLLVPRLNAQESEWKLYKEVNGVQIYEKPTECHDEANGLHQEMILLKFVNTTSRDFNITWTLEAWYDGTCTTCHDPDNPEYQFSTKLKAGESIQGTCDTEEGKTLRIFKGFLDKDNTATLTKFELKNIKANPL
ncbi:MAG: hypothetical protein K9I29_03925 [Bacteroidales bacterium]|nr:hypothetical protein [Bacteroidales bacterium]MCF8327421.1 hypothetical protein [Bacteroidales bacterium]